MDVIKVTIELEDGTIKFLEGTDVVVWVKAQAKFPELFKLNWHEGENEVKLQRTYFRLVEEVAKHGETGYDKDGLHNAIKKNIFIKIQDNTDNFTDGVIVYSTRNLTRQGWISFIAQFKLLAQETFHYQFKI